MAAKEPKAARAAPDSQEVQVTYVPEGVTEAPMLFVDGALGAISDGHLVKFNLYQDIPTGYELAPDAPPVSRTVVARMVMTVATAGAIATWLQKAASASKPAEEKNPTQDA